MAVVKRIPKVLKEPTETRLYICLSDDDHHLLAVALQNLRQSYIIALSMANRALGVNARIVQFTEKDFGIDEIDKLISIARDGSFYISSEVFDSVYRDSPPAEGLLLPQDNPNF